MFQTVTFSLAERKKKKKEKFIEICFFIQDYAEDEDENEDETSASTTLSKMMSSSSTTTTTTSTTTTTTTARPVVTQNYDYRDPRAYEGDRGGTGAQYNGYQSRNDYPPMSAHSVHKWQTLGTRESVKETRGNMQQYNKNGKSKLASIYALHLYLWRKKKKIHAESPMRKIILVQYRNRNSTLIRFMQISMMCSNPSLSFSPNRY